MKRFIYALAVFALLAGAIDTKAQLQDMTSSTGGTIDTVTNTGTVFVTSPVISKDNATTVVQFDALELSGTGAGTVSLLGSIDGTNFRSISSTTYTATDVASPTHQGFIWTITGNPYRQYRISWTGSGTMAYTFSGKIWSH